MKANGLMTGDYLSYHGQIIKVASITKKKVGYHIKDNECRMHYARLCECKTIPLTKEILEKNGFVEKDFYSELIVGDFRILCDLHNVCVYHNEHVNLDIPIEYLHELQHAMRICGIEKTIEL